MSSISNILLDLLFVCIFRTGIAGAAWATVISQGISAFIVLYVLCRDTGMHQLKPGQIRLEKRTMGEIAKMGIPIGIQSGLIAFSNVVVQTNINYFGVDAVSGCSAFLKIDGILVLPLVSFGLAAMTYTSQNLGAGNIRRVLLGKRATMIICMCYIIPASVFVWIFGTPLIGLFSHDKAVIACGKIMVQVMTPGYWMLGVAHVYAGIFRGCGKSFQTMLLMLFNLVVVRFLYLAVAVKIHHTLAVVLSSYTVSWVTVMVSAILMSKFIEKKDGGYTISNPVMNEENFADKWNEYPQKATEFYFWLKAAKRDILDTTINACGLKDFSNKLEHCFGENIVKKVFVEAGNSMKEARENQSLYVDGLTGGLNTVQKKDYKKVEEHTFFGK